jgi:histidinol-phosphatase (PHP family)
VLDRLKAEIVEARDEFYGVLEISVGVELGEPHHDISLAREIVSDPELDFVIASLHHTRGAPDYYYLDYDSLNLDDMMRSYYSELEELVETGCYDVIGHINYQPRYMSERARRKLDLSRYYDTLEKILARAARLGRGIEVNTSGLWRGLGYTHPSEEVLRMFRDAGGEIVTTGSDSHVTSHVGDGIPSAVDCIRSAGFECFTFFKRRRPRFHDV